MTKMEEKPKWMRVHFVKLQKPVNKHKFNGFIRIKSKQMHKEPNHQPNHHD